MPRSVPVGGFGLGYDHRRADDGAVMVPQGRPGDSSDGPLVPDGIAFFVPEPRGLSHHGKRDSNYDAASRARRLVEPIEQLFVLLQAPEAAVTGLVNEAFRV